jgi:signal transduction histidine kinase
VFDRYWQGAYDRSRTERTDAAEPAVARGLGLTIARQVVEAQGGRITLVSSEGVGSRFTVWLPMAADADVAVLHGLHA